MRVERSTCSAIELARDVVIGIPEWHAQALLAHKPRHIVGKATQLTSFKVIRFEVHIDCLFEVAYVETNPSLVQLASATDIVDA